MTDRIVSRPYPRESEKACERCCFGTGEHAPFCKAMEVRVCGARLPEGEIECPNLSTK
jgi:hypothetical protein